MFYFLQAEIQIADSKGEGSSSEVQTLTTATPSGSEKDGKSNVEVLSHQPLEESENAGKLQKPTEKAESPDGAGMYLL